MESKLLKLSKILKDNYQEHINYSIPDLWFLEEYGCKHKIIPNGEVLVNPYEFYSTVIDEYVLKNKEDNIDYLKSLSISRNIKPTNGDWIKKSVIYSSMIRTETSYDHDRSYSLDFTNIDGLKETGTFVKTIAILPLLKKLGVNLLYLLPLSKYSLKNKKGELGSPYGVESFTELDPLLKDDLTKDSMTIDEEFMALMEACHIMGIRVTIDIIPRTNSICSSLAVDHPEWFYWIKASEFHKYRAPYIDKIGSCTYPALKHMDDVYKSEDTLRHIRMFMKNPKDTDPIKYSKIKADNTIDFLEKIEKEFDLKIAPAFSDNINDPQPPWSDVTYFRLYLDDPIDTKELLKEKHNPYILFDTIKTDIYPCKTPNLELWELLSNIIPYYQKTFGIDGARIDMGHALPKELLNMIFKNAKMIDPDFALIAEELNMGRDKASKSIGYNAMIGNGFWALPRVDEGHFKYFITHSKDLAIPVFACVETHDTRRVARRYGNEKAARFFTILDYFIPNTIPFINSGQEIYEVQPMNLGIDADGTDFAALDEKDIYYKKLALFDKYSFHYNNPNSHEIINHLVDVLKTREKWIDTIINLNNYVELSFNEESNYLIGISYYNNKTNKCLIIIGNANMNNGVNTNVNIGELREKANNNSRKSRIVYATNELPRDFYEFDDLGNMNCYLNSGEIKIFEM